MGVSDIDSDEENEVNDGRSSRKHIVYQTEILELYKQVVSSSTDFHLLTKGFTMVC